MDGENWRDNKFPNGYDECYKQRTLVDVEDYDCENALPSYEGIDIDLICKKCGRREHTVPPIVCCGQDMVRPFSISTEKMEKLLILGGNGDV